MAVSRSPSIDERRARIAFLGAGPVVQAIHLPTLAQIADRFEVALVVDPDIALAEAVANRAGANAGVSIADILAAPNIDIVVIASPSDLHAEHVKALATRRDVLVLCEKPLVTSLTQLEDIAAHARGVRGLVGTMHVFDPGWRQLRAAWGDATPTHIRSIICLPPNPRFERMATELTPPSAGSPPGSGSGSDPGTRVRNGILGLAIHSIPLIRDLLHNGGGALPTVIAANALTPSGYALLARVGSTLIELIGGAHTATTPLWRLDAVANDRIMRAQFPPSYVHAGSASGRVVGHDRQHVVAPLEHNGYVVEWKAIWETWLGGPRRLGDAIDDTAFAIALADGAAAAIAAADRKMMYG